MGKKPGGAGGSWLAAVRKVFKTSPSSPSKDPHHAKKGPGGKEQEAADIVSVEHLPAADTSPEVTNESRGAVVWRERVSHGREAEARRGRHAMALRVARIAALRGRGSGSAVRAAVRIQAFYRGYLARRALRALRGLVRLQALVRGHQVRRQVHLTMRCMQALVRAQASVRARRLQSGRLTSHVAGRARPIVSRPVLVPAHDDRHSYGHDPVLFDEQQDEEDVKTEPQMQRPRNSHSSVFGNVSPLHGGWDGVSRAGTLRQHDNAAWPPAYAYGFKQQQQLHKDQCKEQHKRNDVWPHWLERCMDGAHAPSGPSEQANQHFATEMPYETAAATEGASEKTVEMDAGRKSSPKDLYPVRPPVVPGYMVATQSARAKARMAKQAAVPRAHARSRSGSVGLGGGSLASSGWSTSVTNNGEAGVRMPQQREGYSPESSYSGDMMPQPLDSRGNKAAYA